ncbi:MAG TPA: hypothetical protein VFG31_10930, partial [Conexibacter sp.]|nr:hypothetical protein [Conexibacter sp.]
SANSSATTKQANVNVPISVLSKDANNGDVKQSNDATTVASSENSNETNQSNEQTQQGSVHGGDSSCGCDRPESGSSASQDQRAENSNETKQDASSSAETKQANVNVPISVLSKDANNGDVHQSNDAKTIATSENENRTDQSNQQDQRGRVERGKHCDDHTAYNDGSCGDAGCRERCGHEDRGDEHKPCHEQRNPCHEQEKPCHEQRNPCHEQEKPCHEQRDPCHEQRDPCKQHQPQPCHERRREECQPQKDRCKPCWDPCQGSPLGGLIG